MIDQDLFEHSESESESSFDVAVVGEGERLTFDLQNSRKEK